MARSNLSMAPPLIIQRNTFGRRLNKMGRLFQVVNRVVAVNATFIQTVPPDFRRVFLQLGLQTGIAGDMFQRIIGSDNLVGMRINVAAEATVQYSIETSYSLVQNGLEHRVNFGPENLEITEVIYIGG